MKRCPACMSQLGVTDRCTECGFPIASQNEQKEGALPIGTVLSARYELGLALAQSRQSICYIAWDRSKRQPVLAEEFFPKGACVREGGEVKAQGRGAQLFKQAAKRMFDLPCPGDRPLPCIHSFMNKGTCIRIYKVSSGVAARNEAENLLDHPFFFRDKIGKPMMSINALPIPELPKKRNLRVLQKEFRKTKAEGTEQKKKPFRIFIIIAIILIAGIAIGITAWLLFHLLR